MNTWLRLACTSAPSAWGDQLALGVLAPVEAADPGSRHADQVRAPQRQHPHDLDEAQVVADAQPDGAPGRLGHGQTGVAGSEAVLLDVEEVELAVVGDHAVGANGHRGVVDAVSRALAQATHDEPAVAGGLGLPVGDGRAVEGLGQRLKRLAVGAVPRHRHLGHHHDVGALLEQRGGRIDTGLPVGLGRSRATEDLGQTDSSHSIPAFVVATTSALRLGEGGADRTRTDDPLLAKQVL